MGSRVSRVERDTRETRILVEVDLDGEGRVDVDTGVPFFDHMLDQLGRHGRLTLTVHAEGDTQIDAHHTVEDTGIALGQAMSEAWGDRAGVERFGDATVPIDEALTRVAIDLAGRPYLVWEVDPPLKVIGETFETHLVKHFFEAVVANSRMTLHVASLAGDNTHHIFESVFKSFAVALRRALVQSGGGVPSTKGMLQ